MVVGAPQEHAWWEKPDPEQDMENDSPALHEPLSPISHSSSPATRGIVRQGIQEYKELDDMIAAVPMSQDMSSGKPHQTCLSLLLLLLMMIHRPIAECPPSGRS